MSSLSPKKMALVSQLRENVRDIWRQEFEKDSYLMRWLRARNFDLRKAEKMLRNHIEWRRMFGADTILEDKDVPEVLLRFYPGGFCGRSKSFQPLWIEPSGYGDMKGLVKSASLYDLLRSRIFILERIHRELLPRASAEAGHEVLSTAVIYDLEHFGSRHMWRPGLEAFLELTKMCEANYPETMGSCFIVNAPSLFPVLYNLVRPFLHEETIKKIQVLGSNYKEVLLKHFDKEHLPARYGGLLTDADGDLNCRSQVCFGGTVPRCFYLSCDRALMEQLSIARGGSLKLRRSAPTPGYLFTWTIASEGHDIGFSVRFLPAGSEEGSDSIVLRPLRRTIAHIVPEKGACLMSERAGTFELCLDNSYSWTRAKRVWVLLECLDAEGQRQRSEQMKLEAERRANVPDDEYDDLEDEEEEEEEEKEEEDEDEEKDAVSLESFHSAKSVITDT